MFKYFISCLQCQQNLENRKSTQIKAHAHKIRDIYPMLQIISYFLRGYGYATSSLPIGDLKYLPQPIIILIKVSHGFFEIDDQKGKRGYIASILFLYGRHFKY